LSRPDPTFGSRRADYENYGQRSQWIAGGVVAVVGLASQLFPHGSKVLVAAVLTVGIVAGVLAGSARVEFGWAATKLEAERQTANATATTALTDSVEGWPDRAETFHTWSIVLLVFAGLGLLAEIWWAAT
jgi:Na+/glutamate symporter